MAIPAGTRRQLTGAARRSVPRVFHSQEPSYGSVKIQAANSALVANGELEPVGEFFTPDSVAHLTDQDMVGGHAAIRRVLGRFRHWLIAEDWFITDLAEGLLLARKR